MNRFRSQLPAAFLLSGLLAATIALLEPLKSALRNWNEIGINFSELFASLAVPFAVAFFAIAILAVLLLAVAPRRAVPVLVVLCVGLCAQANWFVWEYGSFDGSPIDWSANSRRGIFEVAFWIAALALALAKPEWIRAHAVRIVAVVVALQLAALAGLVHQNAPFDEKTDSEVSLTHLEGTTQLSLIQSVSLYSRDRNAIIIVLDSLQSDLFAEVLRSPELLAAMPPGFTYFRNAVSLYAATDFSLQSILTSKAIPDNIYMRKWRDENIPASLPARLAERGFDTVLTTFSQSAYRDFGSWGYRRVLSATLAEAGAASATWREDVSNLFALGLFRLSPHFAKPWIYDDGRWQSRRLYPPREATARDPKIQYETRTDLAAFDELIASAAVAGATPRFRFLHFYGAHRPFSVDERCQYAGKEQITRESAVAMTRCIVSRLFEYLHKLDAIGVYDRSVIFVVADHGQKYVRLDPSVASPRLPEAAAPLGAASNPTQAPIDQFWMGVPVFLAKALGDRQQLRISDQPVSLCDVPKSVSDALAIENDFKCESVFSARVPREAPRMHYRYPTYEQLRSLGLSPDGGLRFEKFEVVGHSWLPDSWRRVADREPSSAAEPAAR